LLQQLKKLSCRKKIVESQSAFVIQQEELALARHKLDEQARLEALRLEEAAAVAVAKANAIVINWVLALVVNYPHLDLPEENSSQKIEHFIENQCIDPTPNTQVAPSSAPNQPNPSTQHVNPNPQHSLPAQHAPAPQLLNSTASTFTPNKTLRFIIKLRSKFNKDLH
jgi:hypothetical protein